jgi:hypothetical protein
MKKDHLEILLEDIRGKFDLVLEGHESLRKEILNAREESNEKHDLTAFQIKALNKKLDDKTQELHNKIDDVEGRLTEKIDAVAHDLSVHRADTEGHKREYKVSE